jgi:hypothetical protein
MQEESVAKAARELWKDKGRGTIKTTEWSESDGLLMFHSKIYSSQQNCSNVFNLWKDTLILHEINPGNF